MTKKEKIINEIIADSKNNIISDKKFFDIVDSHSASEKMIQEVINEIDKQGIVISSVEFDGTGSDLDDKYIDSIIESGAKSKKTSTASSSTANKKNEAKSTARKELKFEIVEHIGTLSESSKGWKKELNLVSWNDAQPKYDIREWSPEHDRMGKGVTLTEDELKELKKILINIHD